MSSGRALGVQIAPSAQLTGHRASQELSIMLKPIAIAALIVTLGSVTASAQTAAAPGQTAALPAGTKAETVEQRITSLHAALKITPDEETKWNGVAQAMRENA